MWGTPSRWAKRGKLLWPKPGWVGGKRKGEGWGGKRGGWMGRDKVERSGIRIRMGV
jgi:hypothetical protein